MFLLTVHVFDSLLVKSAPTWEGKTPPPPRGLETLPQQGFFPLDSGFLTL